MAKPAQDICRCLGSAFLHMLLQEKLTVACAAVFPPGFLIDGRVSEMCLCYHRSKTCGVQV